MPQIDVLTADRVTGPNDVLLDDEFKRRQEYSGLALSAYLEQLDPSTPEKREVYGDSDAFERQLIRFNIRCQDDLELGLRASTVEDFWLPKENDGKTPLRRDRWAPSDEGKRSVFVSNSPQSWALFPEYINRIIRANPLAEDVLDKLISVTTPIDSQSYQSVYLSDTQASRQIARVGEMGELPRLFVKTSMNTVALGKYGAAVVGTYEFARRIRIPIFTLWLMRVRQQLRLDQANQAVDVIVNGDGNNNSATNYNVSTLDPSAGSGPGTVTDPYLNRLGVAATSSISKLLTYSAFLQWRTTLYPLGMTHIVGRMNELLQILQLQMPTINPTLLLALLQEGGQIGLGRIQLPADDLWGGVELVYFPYAPGGVLVGYNREYTLEMLLETGSDITETDRNILEQTNVLTMTQTTGFDKILAMASTTLTFA